MKSRLCMERTEVMTWQGHGIRLDHVSIVQDDAEAWTTGTIDAAYPETGEPAPLDYWLPGALTLADLEARYGGKGS